MMVFYCRNAGSPYKNEKARKKIHNYAVVVGVWTVAFVLRFVFSFTSVKAIYTQDSVGTKQDSFWFSVLTFADILTTELIPFYFVVDAKFMKMFTLRHLEVPQVTDLESAELQVASPDTSPLIASSRDMTGVVNSSQGQGQLITSDSAKMSFADGNISQAPTPLVTVQG